MDFKEFLKNVLMFKEPKKVEKFILKEKENEGEDRLQSESGKRIVTGKEESEGFLFDRKRKYIQKEQAETGDKIPEISTDLSFNLKYIKKLYSVPVSADVIIREFDIVVKDKIFAAFMVFLDGMVDRKVINDDILQPLMLLSNLDIKSDEKDVAEYIKSHILPHHQLKEQTEFEKVVKEVNFGGCGIFVGGLCSAFTADVKGFEHRGIERPNTELVIRGPQEGFTETIRVNTSLIRKRIKDEKLIVENIEIGKRSKTPCSMLYIKDIANDSLIEEVRRRLKSVKVDYINDIGELEQFIEDSPFLPSPQMIVTERPDRVAVSIEEGKVAVVMDGSPNALIMPVSFFALFNSPEDTYLRFPYGNMIRLVRLLGIIASLLLPSLYIAVTTFHQEMIPTSLLLAIEASREKVPFPSVIEILIMEVSFELIREAGIRIPGPIGPTLGIIGALILGQAAVAANIVSPILIIIVAVTGIGSFAIPNFTSHISLPYYVNT